MGPVAQNTHLGTNHEHSLAKLSALRVKFTHAQPASPGPIQDFHPQTGFKRDLKGAQAYATLCLVLNVTYSVVVTPTKNPSPEFPVCSFISAVSFRDKMDAPNKTEDSLSMITTCQLEGWT